MIKALKKQCLGEMEHFKCSRYGNGTTCDGIPLKFLILAPKDYEYDRIIIRYHCSAHDDNSLPWRKSIGTVG